MNKNASRTHFDFSIYLKSYGGDDLRVDATHNSDDNGIRIEVSGVERLFGTSILFNITHEGLIIDVIDGQNKVIGTVSEMFDEIMERAGALGEEMALQAELLDYQQTVDDVAGRY